MKPTLVPLSTPASLEQRRIVAREAWERYQQQKEFDERLELHRRLALTGGVVLRESV